jgi:hypothetical protein
MRYLDPFIAQHMPNRDSQSAVRMHGADPFRPICLLPADPKRADLAAADAGTRPAPAGATSRSGKAIEATFVTMESISSWLPEAAGRTTIWYLE